LKDDTQTIDNLHKWNEYIDEVKKKLMVQVLAQSDRTCDFLQEQRFGLFTKTIVAIAKGFGGYHVANWKERRVPLSPTQCMVPLGSIATTVVGQANIVSTLLLLGICSLNILSISHSSNH
jgi:hypothetical protein